MKRPLPIAHSSDVSSHDAVETTIDRCDGLPDAVRILQQPDWLAVEEPLEIHLVYGREDDRHSTSLSITMRTPGADHDLAAGFMVSEGIVRSAGDIQSIQHCGPAVHSGGQSNVIKVTLAPAVTFSLDSVQRHFYTTSSCGICGKASLDAVEMSGLQPLKSTLRWTPRLIASLPDRLRQSQPVFQQTGGLHASGLFDQEGNLLVLREDVGRHNALDKVIGDALRKHRLPLQKTGLLVSGRASFELVQKALAGGIEILVAVGAPSSLAVDLARRFGMTLIGFANSRRFNIYSHAQRVIEEAGVEEKN